MDSKLDMFFYTRNKPKKYNTQWIVGEILQTPKTLDIPMYSFFPEIGGENDWTLCVQNTYSNTKSLSIKLSCAYTLHMRLEYVVIFRKVDGKYISEVGGNHVFFGDDSKVLYPNLNEIFRLGCTDMLNVEFCFTIYGLDMETETLCHVGGDDDNALDPPEEFMDMKENTKLVDLKIHVGNESFEAHKFVLRLRIPKFVDEYLKDLSIGEITVKGLQPDAFKDILNYIYDGDVPHIALSTCTEGFYEFAYKYDLKLLQKMCVEELEIIFSNENAVNYLKKAVNYKDETLKEAIYKFIYKNLYSISKRADWKELAESNPELTEEITQLKMYYSLDFLLAYEKSHLV